MKRMIGILTTLLVALSALGAQALQATPDIERHWCAGPANTLIAHGIVQGFGDGRFRPDHAITRIEAAIMLARTVAALDGVEIAAVTAPPSIDVPPERAGAAEVAFLFSRGMCAPYPDGTFWPDAALTREDFASMISGYTAARAITMRRPDLVVTDAAQSYAADAIVTLCRQGILNADADGAFHPAATLTRADAAAAIYSFTGWEEVLPPQTLPNQRVIPGPYISQLSPVYAVVGCEGTSLLMGLKAKGYAQDITLRTFLDGMPKHDSNPNRGFVGSPYKADPTKQTRTTIAPSVLAAYAAQYGDVRDCSGSSPAELQAELLSGNPVVIYATMRWETPTYRTYLIEGTEQTWLSNNHAVLLSGYDSDAHAYFVRDPYNILNEDETYEYWISGDVLEPIYEARRQAIVVR